MEVTPEERRAINALKKVAKAWPKTLWLWSANGTLCVMKLKDGKQVMIASGGVDSDYEVDVIKGIDNDGGDW